MSFPLDTLPVWPGDLDAKDPFELVPQLMSLMKNTLIRGMNNIHQIAGEIGSSHPSFKDYLSYVSLFCNLMRAHFQGDSRFFKHCTESGESLEVILSGACNPDTQIFQESLEHLRTIVQGYTENPAIYSAMSVRECLAFGPKMVKQMRTQIEAIRPEELRKHFSPHAIKEMVQESMKSLGDNTELAFLVPYIFAHHDPATSQYWPPSPEDGEAKLRAILKAYEGVWQFAPFDPITREVRLESAE